MKHWYVTALTTVLVVGLGAGGMVLFGSAATVTLISDGPVQVYDRATADPSQRQVIGTLKPGEEVAVTNCIDLKHYIVPEVALPDGKMGYIIDGKFHLRRKSPWSSPGKPTAFGC